jgi:hypothetical protein
VNLNVRDSSVILIGLLGSLGVVTTAISSFLYYSHGFNKINLTDPVKEVAYILGRTDRQSLKTIRQVFRESLGEDVWIKLLDKRINDVLSSKLIRYYSIPGVSEVKPVLRVVVEDIAYRNEFDYIKEKNGLLIGFQASENQLYERFIQKGETISLEEFRRWLKHSSEVEIPSLVEKCDFIIDIADLSLLKIEEKVDEMVRMHLIEKVY